jgi:DNA-binding response OmpR family regulator
MLTNMGYTVLVAEDDIDILNILKLYLESSAYRVLTAHDGLEAWELVQREAVDFAILDVMMPGMDGFELTKKIRETKSLPIMLLTARAEDHDKILGLNLGADDYMTKPFNPLEVIARVNSNLRRVHQFDIPGNGGANPGSRLSLGELCLDTETLILTKNGQEITLTPNEYKLLHFLMAAPGRVFTKSQLCEAVNGEFYENYENAIMVHISHLRDKIESDPKNPEYIKNIRGLGYKIEYKK